MAISRRGLLAAGSLCLVILATGLVNELFAQQKPGSSGSAPAASAVEKPNAKPSEQPDGAKDEWQRLIYLPFKKLQEVYNKPDATVFLPLAEYVKLWGQGPQAERLPVEAVITEARYQARIEKEIARIGVKYQVQVLGKAWSTVAFSFGDAAVGKMTSADERVVLQGTGDGQYALLFPQAGQYVVELELAARVNTSPEGRSFRLAIPAVGITELELTIPQADQAVTLLPNKVLLPIKSDPKETHIKAALGATRSIEARWNPRAGLKPDMELLTSVFNEMRVNLDNDMVHTDAALKFDVLRGELKQTQIALPVGHRILDVTSPTAKVRGWKTAVEKTRQVLTIEFLSPITKEVTVEVHTERPLPDDRFELAGIAGDGTMHGIHALNALRENGQLAVSYPPQVSLVVVQQQGLTRMAEGEVRSQLRSPHALYFKYYNPKFQLQVAVKPVQPHVIATQQTRLVFREDELQLTSLLNYQVERAGIFEFKVGVPENLTVDRVSGSEVKEYHLSDDKRTLTVQLNGERRGNLSFQIQAHQPLQSRGAESELSLPILEPQNVERETGEVGVYAPESLEVITLEDKLVAVEPAPTTQMPTIGGTRLASVWNYHRRPVAIVVKTIRKPTYLTARVGTQIDVRQELVEVRTTLEYVVRYAGLNTFKFAVPAAVADRVQINSLTNSPAIQQKSRAEEAVDGWVVWTVVMQREVLGTHRFEVRYDIAVDEEAKPDAAKETDKAADSKEGSPMLLKDLVVKPLKVLGLDEKDSKAGEVALAGITGEISVSKDRALAVTAASEGAEIEPIDVRQLAMLAQDGYLAFRYHQQPVQVTLSAQRHALQEVVETVISRALVEAVISREEHATFRCRYVMKSSERQRLRIGLPVGMEPLAVLIDGRQVSLERDGEPASEQGWETYYLNLAREKSSDESFHVTLQYMVPINPRPFTTAGGKLQLRLPRIGGTDAVGVAVQRLKAVVWVPEEYALVGTPENFVGQTRRGVIGLLGGPSLNRELAQAQEWVGFSNEGLFDFPTSGTPSLFTNLGGADRIEVTWWEIRFYSWVLSGALFVIAWLLRKTPWENKLGLLILIGFLAVLLSLQDASMVLQGLGAAWYGLVAMIAFWLIHALFGKPADNGRKAASVPLPTSVGPPVAAVIPPPGIFDDLNEAFGKSDKEE